MNHQIIILFLIVLLTPILLCSNATQKIDIVKEKAEIKRVIDISIG